jgi:hypothetical protein
MWRAFTATQALTRRLATPLQRLLPVQLFGAGDEARASGYDKVSVVSLTGGHAACYASRQHPRSPPMGWVWTGCAG